MNLVDLLDEKGLQQDEWSLTAPTFGSEGQLTVIGWSGRNWSNKLYILKCSKCSDDNDLFGEGYFRSMKGDLLRLKVPCGCSKSTNWSREQYTTLCTRKAKELGYTFLGFEGEWRSKSTRIKMLCDKHGEWNSCIINRLISRGRGCPGCKADLTSERLTKPDDVMIASFLASGAFHPDTEFWRSERITKAGYKSHWYVSCPECGEIGESFSGDLQQGSRSCGCSDQRQREAYINWILDNSKLIAIKFGIASNTMRRVKNQNRNSIYQVLNAYKYTFADVISCKAAERECKSTLACGVINKQEMADGHTETTSVQNLSKIEEIYKKHGGVKT